MVIVYSVGILTILIFLLITHKYREEDVKKIDKKKHQLKMLYPSSLFVVDRLPKRIVGGNTKINRKLKELSLKDKIKEERDIYMASKVSIVILVLIAGFLLAIGITLTSPVVMQQIYKLNRNKGTSTYEFIAKRNNEEKKIRVDVAPKKRTKKETYKAIEKNKKVLVKKVLAKNKSANRVDRPIKLIDTVGEEDIKVSWSIDNSDVIGYDGEIGKTVSKQGKIVRLTATMELDRITEDYTFHIKVFPQKETNDLQEGIQSFIDENDITKKTVSLPKKVGGKVYKYFIKSDNYGVWILPIALVIAILVFVLKDRDLQKEVDERQKQMLRDYPNVVSKLLIYFGAGLSIKSAMERIVVEYKKEKKDVVHYAYEEMDMAITKMNSGISDATAIAEFGDRCGIHCYIKLANIIEQNLRRGSKDMVYALKNEVNVAVNTRKNNILKEGSEISTKLLGPMIIMLIISVVIIMVPAFMSINF